MGEMSDQAREAQETQIGQAEEGGAPRDPAGPEAVNQSAQSEAGQVGAGSDAGDAFAQQQGGSQSPGASGADAEDQTGNQTPAAHGADTSGQARIEQPPSSPVSTYHPDTGSEAGPRQETSGATGTQPEAAVTPLAPVATQPGPAPLEFANQPLGKKRNPVGVVVLSFITIGIYFLYWYGTINAEMRRHDPRIHVNVALAVLAQFVPIVNLVSAYNTSQRVKSLEIADGTPNQISPVLSVLFMIFLNIGYPIQVQMHLNRQWDHHLLGLGLK